MKDTFYTKKSKLHCGIWKGETGHYREIRQKTVKSDKEREN